MARIAGRIAVSYDGKTVRGEGDFTINFGKDKREILVGVSGVDGHSSMPQAAKISGNVRWTPNVDIEEILESEGATVVVRLANGWTASIRNAVNTTEGELSTENATIPMSFEGDSLQLSQ